MKFLTTITAALLCFSATVSAVPTADPFADAVANGWEPVLPSEVARRMETSPVGNELDKRTPGGIYICTQKNWSGRCFYKVYPFQTCIKLEKPFYHNIHSFGPDKGAYCRITYTAEECTIHGDLFVDNPGKKNLNRAQKVNGKWVPVGDLITSFLCQRCTACDGTGPF